MNLLKKTSAFLCIYSFCQSRYASLSGRLFSLSGLYLVKSLADARFLWEICFHYFFSGVYYFLNSIHHFLSGAYYLCFSISFSKQNNHLWEESSIYLAKSPNGKAVFIDLFSPQVFTKVNILLPDLSLS